MRFWIIFAVAILMVVSTAEAGPLRQRLEQRMIERKAAQIDEELDPDGVAIGQGDIPAGVRVLRDIAYGSDSRQTFDVYLPENPQNAAVIFMVHGGGWAFGDKLHGRVVKNKVARWVPQGLVFISVNYRMMPDADPAVQAQDVAAALAEAQKRAVSWGADPQKFMLMGHSAGAHLVMLLNADPEMAFAQGAKAWLGTVSLDSGAINVPALMKARHAKLYDRAFGADENFWMEVSPYHRMTRNMPPSLLVCSSKRADSCSVSQSFILQAEKFGAISAVLPEDLSHGDVNGTLGLPGDYTDKVESFMHRLGVL